MDGCGLKREKSGLTFSSFNDMPAKFNKIYYDQCYLMEFVSYDLNNFTVLNILCAGRLAPLRLNSRNSLCIWF